MLTFYVSKLSGPLDYTTQDNPHIAEEPMKPTTLIRTLGILRKTHSLLGVFIFPLVLVAGFTGFYLNHSSSLFSFLASQEYDESQFVTWSDVVPTTVTSASALANTIWPKSEITRLFRKDYHNRPSYFVETPDGTLIVSRETGHYFVKTGFTRTTYAPDGELINKKFYWGALFKSLHVRGWPSDRFGTLLGDITSIALMLFAISGAIVWWTPRIRRLRRKS
ncbi:MAG: hypothetical protein COB40_09305 [Marinosulfonomonas sp.]|nr:MAG: hypothetical protein COB40_09305 [Marinosulfonomonas sp.]